MVGHRRVLTSTMGLALVLALAFAAAFVIRGEAHAAEEDVSIVDFAFNPSTITVHVGDTVTWTNNGVASHTVTSTTPAGVLDSPTLNTGGTYSETFDTPGTYNYMCAIHPSMTGSVVVEAATSTTTATATATTTTATPTTATATPTTATATPTTPTATTTTTTTPGASTTPLAGATTLTLTGNEEIPPAVSNATGQFQYRVDGNTLVWRLVAQGNGQTFTMAHIHLGARGAAGPIVETLFTGNRTSADLAGVTDQAGLEGQFAGNMAGFMSALQAGNLYVNVHSSQYPGGVLRAQLSAQAGSATATTTGTATVAPSAPSTGTGLGDGSSNTALVIAGLGALAAAGAGGATLAVRRKR